MYVPVLVWRHSHIFGKEIRKSYSRRWFKLASQQLLSRSLQLVRLFQSVTYEGLKNIHLGKTLGEMHSTLLALVRECLATLTIESKVWFTCLWGRWRVRDVCTWLSSLVKEDKCVGAYTFRVDSRDTLETIDHSTGDVAYLRITAHTDDKDSKTPLNLLPPPVFDTEFKEVYDKVKAIPPFNIPARTEMSLDVSAPPRLVQIGEGTYAVDSISSVSDSPAEIQVRHCLDKLMCNNLAHQLV